MADTDPTAPEPPAKRARPAARRAARRSYQAEAADLEQRVRLAAAVLRAAEAEDALLRTRVALDILQPEVGR